MVHHFLSLLSRLTFSSRPLLNRIDDMKLESFDGLEMISKEILQQGTRKIAATIRGLLIAQRLKENKDATSFR